MKLSHAFFALLVAALLAATPAAAQKAERMIVLGFDGMDYGMATRLIEEGKLPNLARLAKEGSFTPLGTSVPPQSPVAWSNFITGLDSGGHGIYDFIHRDPKTMIPYLSTSRVVPGEKTLKLGKWQFPLEGGTTELLRTGISFWEVLEKNGVECTIVRMPANYPPSGAATRELSGMGTPDILGSYGTFSFFTTDDSKFRGRRIGGGDVYPVRVRDGMVTAKLHGPPNPFLVEPEDLEFEFRACVDPVEDAVKLEVGDEERILTVGEWTDWIPIDFKLIALKNLAGMVRFHLMEVRPEFKLYATPVNFDPLKPEAPISTPASYATDLAKGSGRFYTQGMPEDTKALSEGVFTADEYMSQARIPGQETIEQYKWVLGELEKGLLFYYFGNLDLIGHMMWRTSDPEHPAYDPEEAARHQNLIENLYREMDEVAGYTLDHMEPGTRLVIMSDHGFTSWRRAFHLNAWLRDNGYLEVIDPFRKDDPGLFLNVDWSRTRAYGLGLNGLYLNIAGREKRGIVRESEREALMNEIREKLLETIDPATGETAITKVYRREVVYESRGKLEIGPDLVVGCAKGTRISNESALGEVPPEVFTDNDGEWTGDHCMDHETVPGVLFSNRPLKRGAASLKDLGGAILAEFGVENFDEEVEERLRSMGYIAAGE